MSKSHDKKISFVVTKMIETFHVVSYMSLFREAVLKYFEQNYVEESDYSRVNNTTNDIATRDISFYKSLGMEPTVLTVGCRVGQNNYATYIAIKAYPVFVESSDMLIEIVNKSKNRGFLERITLSLLPKFLHKDVYSSKILKTITSSLLYKSKMNSDDLSDYIGSKKSVMWSYAISFMSYDLTEEQIDDLYVSYKSACSSGILGDIVIVDPSRDLITYCTTKTGICDARVLSNVAASILNKDPTEVIDITSSKPSSITSIFQTRKRIPSNSLFNFLKKTVEK